MAAIPFPPPPTFEEFQRRRMEGNILFHNMEQLDLWLIGKIDSHQLYDNIALDVDDLPKGEFWV